MASLFADENFPGPTTEGLRELGHDVLTTRAAGLADREALDGEVLRVAHEHGRAVLTLNRRDFVRLHNAGAEHSGIIACTEDLEFGALALRIDQAIRSVEPLKGKLIRITRPG